MIAVDTNVVVRLLTGDDPDQTRRASAVFSANSIWLAKTVLLESEWVLRKTYGFARADTISALRRLIALPNVNCEDQPAVTDALAWADQGLDFADSLHVASGNAADWFGTFDDRLVKRAGRLSRVAVKAL